MGSEWKRRKIEAERRKKAPGQRPPGEGRVARAVACPYCYEATRHEVPTTHDERRPVTCPRCGLKFDLDIRSDGWVHAVIRPSGRRRGVRREEPTPPAVTPANVIATLVRLNADRQNGVFTILEYGACLEPPAPSPVVRRMQQSAERDLGVPVPDSYAALLLMSNGLFFNGARFKPAERLVHENLAAPLAGVVVLGQWYHGDNRVYEFVYDPHDDRFHVVPEGKPDERLESFDTLEELLVAVVEGRDFR